MACLFTFAAIGYIAGRVADQIVHDSVRTRLEAEMSVRQAPGPTRGVVRS
jgi:outer membrane lipoprotein SlyB